MHLTRFRFLAFYLASVAILLGLLGIHLTSEWRYMHDDNGALYSIIGYSHVARGLSVTKWHNVLLDATTGEVSARYLHHPPLLGLSLALAFELTGITAWWVPRAVAVLYHLGVVLGTSWLAFRLFRRNLLASLLTGALFAVMPMSTYFGKLVDYPPITTCFVVLALVCHYEAMQAWRSGGSRWALRTLSLLLWLLATQSEWVAHSFLVAFGLLALYEWKQSADASRPRLPVLALLLGGTSVVGLVGAFLHIYWIGGSDGIAELGRTALGYSEIREVQVQGLKQLVAAPLVTLDQARRYFAFGPLFLAAVWLFRIIRNWRERQRTERERWLLALLFGGSLHVLVEPEITMQHGYYLYYLLPFVVLASVDVMVSAWDRFPERAARARYYRAWAWTAGIALLTLAHAVWMIQHRYSSDWGHAVSTVKRYTSLYVVPPGQRTKFPIARTP